MYRNHAKRHTAAFAVCLFAVALGILDTAKVNVAIPAIQQDLGANSTLIQLIVAGYPLALGLVLIPAGRIGDGRSRRTLFLLGLTIFGVASVACTLAPNTPILSAARVLAGVGAGVLLPQALGLIQQLFKGARARGKAFGLYGVATGLTAGLAPPIGGLLQGLGGEEWGWRLIFFINVPLVLLVWPFAFRHLPRDQPDPTARRDLDPLGVFLLSLTIFLFMVPFVFTTGTAEDPQERWLLIPIAIVFGWLFWQWEERYKALGRSPTLDLSLFSIRSFRNGVAISFAYYMAAPGALLLTTLIFQLHLEKSPLFSGLAMLPFGIAFTVSAWMCGNLTARFGRMLVIGGLSVVAFGWTMATVSVLFVEDTQITVLLLLICQSLAGAGSGAVGSPNQTLMLEEIKVGDGGLAGSVTQVAQRIGTAIGIAIAAAVFYTVLTSGDSLGRGMNYPLAYSLGIGAVVLMTLLSLIFAWSDWAQRRRSLAHVKR